MKVTLSITERVNLGNFEFVEVTAGIEFEDDEAVGEPEAYAAEQLDVLLLSHRRRAQSMLSEESESFMNYHPALER